MNEIAEPTHTQHSKHDSFLLNNTNELECSIMSWHSLHLVLPDDVKCKRNKMLMARGSFFSLSKMFYNGKEQLNWNNGWT